MTLDAALKRLTLAQRKALYRVAKTRARAFFKDPKAMIKLRESANNAKT
jgi:hypothetical protein